MSLKDYLKEVEERAEKATEEGAWSFDGKFTLSIVMPEGDYHCRMHPENGDFVAHSRTDIPKLIKLCRVMMEGLREAEEMCSEHNKSAQELGFHKGGVSQSEWDMKHGAGYASMQIVKSIDKALQECEKVIK